MPSHSVPESTRRRRKEARPQELTAAALALFTEKGFAATRLEDIAARAGVSKGTLYLYFDSKEALFEAVIRESIVPAMDEGEAMAAQGVRILCPASELAVMGLSDRILVLHHGEKIAEGSPSEISGSQTVLDVYFGEAL